MDRTERWVSRNWTKSEDECKRKRGNDGRPVILSQESKEILLAATCKKGTSLRGMAKEILKRRGKRVSHMEVKRFYQREGISPHHEINKPLKTAKNREDRLWYADYLSEFQDADYLRLAPSE